MEREGERLWGLSEVAAAVQMSVYGVRKRLERLGVPFAEEGGTRDGGRKWREGDLRRAFGERFDGSMGRGECRECGRRDDGLSKTRGLCLDCWCRRLNKYLIGRGMSACDAMKAVEAEMDAEEVKTV